MAPDSTDVMPGLPDLGGPALEVAPALLGAVVRHGDVAVSLTEVEAYAGADDPGSHAFRGETARNSVMFGPAGRLYVYFTYGMHHCCNVVTGPAGVASAVLLRAGRVIDGPAVAAGRRPGVAAHQLARGPANLCRTLGIDTSLDGTDLTAGPVLLEPGERPTGAVLSGPRVGLRGAPDRPWRFWIEGDRTVSAYRPATPRPRG